MICNSPLCEEDTNDFGIYTQILSSVKWYFVTLRDMVISYLQILTGIYFKFLTDDRHFQGTDPLEQHCSIDI